MQGPFLYPRDKNRSGEVSKSTWGPCLEMKQECELAPAIVEWGLETISFHLLALRREKQEAGSASDT